MRIVHSRKVAHLTGIVYEIAIPPRRKEDSRTFHTESTEYYANEVIGVLGHREHGELRRNHLCYENGRAKGTLDCGGSTPP